MPILVLLLALALGSVAASAAEETEQSSGSAAADPVGEQEETVVVTASKHGQKITEAPAAVTVLTSEDIEAAGAVTLPDLFRRVPGLDFIQVSARDYNVNARGFVGVLSRRLLVLVDGRSVYVDLMGFTLWDTIQVNLDDIERIEVVRGPGSALYGANASSGVVNIITKSPGEIDGTEVRLGYGEGATTDVGFLYGKSFGKLGFKASGSYFATDPFEGPDLAYINDEMRKQDEGTKQPRTMARLQYDMDEEGLFMLDAGYGGTSGILFTGIGPLEIQPGSHLAFVRGSYRRGDLFVQTFWNGLSGETFNLTAGQDNSFDTGSYDAELQWSHAFGSHFLVAGGNARYSDIQTDLASEDQTELLYGAYAQDEWKLGKGFTANLALRVDRDELIGTVAAPKGGIVWAADEKNSLRLTYATAYNSSSFIESYLDFYWPIDIGGGNTYEVFAVGNPELEPERITTYELGYRAFPMPGMLLDVSLFHSRMKDYVSFVPVDYYVYPGFPKTYSYVNVGNATQSGLELSVDQVLPRGFGVSATYSYTDSNQEDDGPGVTAKNKGSLTLQYSQRGWDGFIKGATGSVCTIYQDELTYTTATPFYPSGTVPSYVIVNGAIFVDFLQDGGLSFGIRGTNLLDKRHQQYIVGDYIERRVVAELRARF